MKLYVDGPPARIKSKCARDIDLHFPMQDMQRHSEDHYKL